MSATGRFPATVIDLSTLPKPQIIEALSYEAILSASKADAIERAAKAGIVIDTLDLETELITIVLEACAYRELLVRKKENDDALELLLAFATGADLEHIGARFGVTRMKVFAADGVTVLYEESDERLRKRIQLAPDAYSNAGTLRGYQYNVLSASLEIEDCNVFSPAPGRIDIVLASADGQPTDSALDTVYKHIMSDDVRPLTDDVRISKANVLPYTIDALLRIPRGPDPGLVKAASDKRCRSYAKSLFKVGGKVYRSGIIASLTVPNVTEVILPSPAANLDPGSYGIAKPDFKILTEIVDG